MKILIHPAWAEDYEQMILLAKRIGGEVIITNGGKRCYIKCELMEKL
jgi:hypothetical protein